MPRIDIYFQIPLLMGFVADPVAMPLRNDKSYNSGWPQTWKTQGICKIVKISGKTQGNLNFSRKKPGKLKENEKYGA